MDPALDIACGSFAGACAKLIEYPFDTAKVILQTQDPHNPLYRGALHCLYKKLKTEGIRGLYRGIYPPLVGAASENAVLFMSYTYFSEVLSPIGLSTTALALTAGSLSGIAASFVLTPIELVKCRVQVTHMSGLAHKSAYAHIRQILANDGVKGLWKGQLGTALRECGGSAAWFGTYKTVREVLHPDPESPHPLWVTYFAGGCAGIAYNLSLFPADTVKSHMQTQDMLGRQTSGFLKTARLIYAKRGIQGLYNGCGITCARAAPSSAIIFLIYETLKEWAVGSQGK